MVSQLTVQFNDSQQLISQTPLNLSLQETKTLDYNKNSSQEELYNILLTKEKKITELTSKVQKLEGSVIDLQVSCINFAFYMLLYIYIYMRLGKP